MAAKDYDPLPIVAAFMASVSQTDETIYVGIDPGSTGAIGFVCGRKHCAVDIPTIKVGRNRVKMLSDVEQALTGKKTKSSKGTTTQFNYQAIIRLFRLLKPAKERIYVALEVAQVQMRGKGANAYTGYRVGVAYAIWPLFLASKGYPVELLQPAQWKRHMGLIGKEKEYSRLKAISMFPRADLALKQDHDRAEALLMAYYVSKRKE